MRPHHFARPETEQHEIPCSVCKDIIAVTSDQFGDPETFVCDLCIEQGLVKKCSCCGLLITAKAWGQLKALPPQRFGTKVGGVYRPDFEIADLEMRNCFCGSTLTLPLQDDPGPVSTPRAHLVVFRAKR